MKKAKHFLRNLICGITTAVLLTAGTWWFFFHNRDERLIRALVSELESTCAKSPGRSNAMALLDAATPERIFAPEVKITSDQPGIDRTFKLKELGQWLLAAKKNCSSLTLSLYPDAISVDGDTAVLHGEANVKGSAGKGTFNEVRSIELRFSKIDGKWKISGIKAARIIKR